MNRLTINDFIKIVEEEWKKGSFLPLFYGSIGYEEQLTKYLPASVPTDWNYVIKTGIYGLYGRFKDSSIIELCRKNIEEMLESDTPFSVWCGYNVCFSIILAEKRGSAPFTIMDTKMMEKLKTSLDKNKKILRNARIWNGANEPDGLWSDIERSSKVLEEEFEGIHLLDRNGEEETSSIEKTDKAYLRGTVSKDVKALLGKKLQEYVDYMWKEKQSLPRAVRINGMDIPHIDANYGSFGDWKPEPAHNAIPKQELEKIFGVEVNDELYEYYRGWRFASIDWKIGNLDISMDPIYENTEGQTSFFFTVMLDDVLYFKLGTAYDRDSKIEYTLLFKSSGGVYLLEDEDDSKIIYLAENITALLNNVK